MANIAVSRFDRREALAWLGGTGAVPTDGATLAELFALTSNNTGVEAGDQAPATGQYL